MSTPNEQPGGERPAGPESFSGDESPATQPEGGLVPPPPKPPTALGAGADPLFPSNPQRHQEAWRQPGWGHRTRFAQFATEIFDALDGVADRIAEILRLRQ